MTDLKLEDISKAMRNIDICLLTTKHSSGQLRSRPMSNNRDVDYNGDSYFFSKDDCSAIQDIEKDNNVDLGFISEPAIFGKSFYLSVTGRALLVRDRAEMKKHWVKDLEVWFEKGVETPGIVMIHVKAEFLKYWEGYDSGEIKV